MVRKTRKQKEKAAKRREYLARLVREEHPKEAVTPEVKEEAPKEVKPEKVKVVPVEYITLDFKKALLLSGLFITILIILAILETKYGFLGPLASRLMERLVG